MQSDRTEEEGFEKLSLRSNAIIIVASQHLHTSSPPADNQTKASDSSQPRTIVVR